MNKQLKVLVTACGCPGGPSVIRALRDECYIIGTDVNEKASGRLYSDKFYSTPTGNDPAFIDTILKICSKERPDAVLPESSSEVQQFALHRAEFENRDIKILVSQPQAIDTALDKWKTYQAAGKNVPLPRSILVNDLDELNEAVKDFGFPKCKVVMKSTTGKGSRGFHVIVDTVDRLTLNMREWPNTQIVTWQEVIESKHLSTLFPLLVMEYLDGDEASADIFRFEDQSFGFIKIRRNCKLGLHHHHEAHSDEEMWEHGLHVADTIGLEYFINVQFMACKLMEVNPRISTMLYTPDFNMTLTGVKMALGMDVTIPQLTNDIRAQYFTDLRSYQAAE